MEQNISQCKRLFGNYFDWSLKTLKLRKCTEFNFFVLEKYLFFIGLQQVVCNVFAAP